MDDLKPKIYERNPDTGVIRWRYLGESPNDYSWPHYGNILTKEDVGDIEYSLNEGGYGFSDIRINNQPLFGIGYREKKICWIKITAFGIPGHGSQPHGTNATAKITNALNKIIAWHQENYNENFQSKDDDLNNIMNEVIDPELVAMNQSTLNITRLNAGNKHNVIPAKAEAILDCRLPNYIDSNEFIHTIKNLVNDDAILFEKSFSLEKNISLWSKSQSGDEKELDELLSRQISRDSDLWIVEIESRQGNAYLDDI